MNPLIGLEDGVYIMISRYLLCANKDAYHYCLLLLSGGIGSEKNRTYKSVCKIYQSVRGVCSSGGSKKELMKRDY